VVRATRHLLRARDLIDARYGERLDVAELAHAARASPAPFSRSFTKAFGTSTHRYLTTRRIERAKHLLDTTDEAILEIGLTVGFETAASFSAAFSRVVAVGPRAYRRLRERRPTRHNALRHPRADLVVGRGRATALAIPRADPQRPRPTVHGRRHGGTRQGARRGRSGQRRDYRDRRLRADFEELKARGVEFHQEPMERDYGVDAAFRDPSGNRGE
jgi:AraC-like DNA-binding protein